MSDKQNLEEQIISQVAERTISNQLEAAEQIDIYIETDILKIVQGQAEGVTIAGQGLVTKQNIRVQEIQLKTDRVSVNPLSAIFGQVQLDSPLDMMARVRLTEADINSALASDFTRNFYQNFDLDVDGETVHLHLQQIQIFLPDHGQMECQGKLMVEEQGNTHTFGFTARLRLKNSIQSLRLESFSCHEGECVSLKLVASLIQKFKGLLNQNYFTWEDIKVRIQDIEIKKQNLLLLLAANITQIPNTITEL